MDPAKRSTQTIHTLATMTPNCPPEQPDSNSGQARDDEPAQELSQDREATQQFSTNPDDYDNQQYPQQSDYQNAQYPQDWNQYPQSGDGWGSESTAPRMEPASRPV